MKCDLCGGPVEEKEVAYMIEYKGHIHVIEKVPAKVCLQCGERLYSPETVRKIQKAIWEDMKPDRIVEMPVVDYEMIN